MWTANPLLFFELVGGAHNDVLAITFALAGLSAFGLSDPVRPRPGESRGSALAGLLLGLAAAMKLNVAIVGGGPAWMLLRRPREVWGAWRVRRSGATRVRRSATCSPGSRSLVQIHQASKSRVPGDTLHLARHPARPGESRGQVQFAGPAVLTFGRAALLLTVLTRDVVQLRPAALMMVLARLRGPRDLEAAP